MIYGGTIPQPESEEPEFFPEEERIINWRWWCLYSAGYALDHALDIARKREIDTQFAIDTIRRGCDEWVAWGIFV